MRQPEMTPEEIAGLYDPALVPPILEDAVLDNIRHAYTEHNLRMAGGVVALQAGVTVGQMTQGLGPRLRQDVLNGGFVGPYVSARGQVKPHGIGVWVEMLQEETSTQIAHRRTIIKRPRNTVE